MIPAAGQCDAVINLDPGCRLQAELPGRAISSAVEHLPYKEIVTGSIPVSPIPPDPIPTLASLH